jgi:hypothetical protein
MKFLMQHKRILLNNYEQLIKGKKRKKGKFLDAKKIVTSER